MKHKIKLVIVGDGIAAWMCAAALVKQCDGKICEITLVEQSNVNDLAIETSLPSFKHFNTSIGIDEPEFMSRTYANFNLATRFNDWANIGDSYFQPFGIYGDTAGNIDFLNHWLRSTAHGNKHSLADYCYTIQACKQGLFDFPDTDTSEIKASYSYGYQFNAQLYLDLLKEKFSPVINLITSAVNEIQVNSNTSHIESILVESGEKITADYFIDCTDSAALLIGETLGVKQTDCTEHLPCNRMISVMSNQPYASLPYAIAKANSAGWQWQRATQDKTSYTYFYDNKYISDQEAFDELISPLNNENLSPPTFTELQSTYRQQAWYKNCIAIGNSAATFDPLASGNLYLIEQAILNLIVLFPNKTSQQLLASEYNRRAQETYTQIQNLLTSHYYLTKRTDSKFWLNCQNIQLPVSLARTLHLFEKRAFLDSNINVPFSIDNWISTFLGQGLIPKAVNPLYNNVPINAVEKKLQRVLAQINEGLTTMPSHQAFVTNYAKDKI